MNPVETPVALGADHAGTGLKATLREALEAAGHPVLDLGTHGPESVDYPDFAAADTRHWGILIQRPSVRRVPLPQI
jgi:hypothetical protein